MAEIREARALEFDELWRLDQECFPPEQAYSRFELMRYMRRPGAFTLVADGAAAIAGYIVAECRKRADRGAGHIITLDVRESARRGGVGSRLMDAAEKRLVESGCQAAFLETAINNVAAIAFYKKHGYAVLKTLPRYYNGQLDGLLMGKKL